MIRTRTLLLALSTLALAAPAAADGVLQGDTLLPLARPSSGTDLWTTPEELTKISGFQVKPQGLCLDEICVPTRADDTKLVTRSANDVRINAAANPGLVFDSNWNDWLAFLCGVQPGGGCRQVRAIGSHRSRLKQRAVTSRPIRRFRHSSSCPCPLQRALPSIQGSAQRPALPSQVPAAQRSRLSKPVRCALQTWTKSP